MKEIWAAYCGEDWEPGTDNAEPSSRARAQADVIRGRMSSSIESLLARLPTLEARVQILLAKKESKRQGTKLQSELAKQKPRLEKLAASETWKGNSLGSVRLRRTAVRSSRGGISGERRSPKA